MFAATTMCKDPAILLEQLVARGVGNITPKACADLLVKLGREFTIRSSFC